MRHTGIVATGSAQGSLEEIIRYKVIRDYQSPYPTSVVFEKGEAVVLGKEFLEDPAWKGWIWCEAGDHRKAWVPEQYLDASDDRGTLIVTYDAKELSLRIGEVITVTEWINGFGMAEKSTGDRGWVPLRNLSTIR